MTRVLITGNAGSGKTTFARELTQATGLPWIKFDRVVWRAGWRKASAPERRADELAIAAQAAWVVDGVSDLLLDHADIVVFLDQPRWRCASRVLKRSLPYLRRSRPELPDDCPEWKILLRVIRLIWRYPQTQPQKVEHKALKQPGSVMHIRNAHQRALVMAQLIAHLRA